ncbi:uncharacterized protein LOC144427343 [Styela clava]
MEAVPIAEITHNGKFKLKIANLTAILEKLKCQDLAVVSMAGAYRTGKSFMLNFFIRYLRQRGWENKDWFGPDDMKIQDAFEWSRGADRHTLGIFVWPEIFYVKKDGKQVGVLIVDTQGLFDNGSSPDTNVNIMSISTLLSSHQILNFKNVVCGTDLEHLQLSLWYAMAASQSFPSKGKSFQRLTILVRDWSNSHQHEYGRGGDDYINNVLQKNVPNQAESVGEVKKSIHSGFDHVDGFLMSRPNENVDGGKSFKDLQNSDINGPFREHIIMLVDSVLQPKNLVVKKLFGQPISANGLINLISEFSTYIQSGKQPKIDTLLESAIKVNNATAVQDSVLKYKCRLKQLVDSPLSSDNQLYDHHEIALKEAKDVFFSIATLGSGKQTQNVWNHVIEQCKMLYKNKAEEIRLRKSANIQELRMKADEMEKKYVDKMNRLATNISSETLMEKHMEYFYGALEKYERKTASLRDILGKDGDHVKKQLENRIEFFYQQMHQQRETLEKKNCIAKEKEQIKIQKVTQDCLKDFQRRMALSSDEFISEIEEVCQNEKQNILQRYDNKCGSFADKYEVKKGRDILQDELADHCKRVVKNNERNLEIMKSKCAGNSQTAAHEYDKKMENLMDQSQLHTDEILDKNHAEFKKFAKFRFDELLQSMPCPIPKSVEEEYISKLEEVIENQYQVYKNTNDKERKIQNMEKDSRECARHAKTALGVYTQQMNQLLGNAKYYSQLNLKKKHLCYENEALDKFEDLTANLTCSKSNFRESLTEEIKEKFSQYRRMNSKHHNKEKQRLIKSVTDEYETSMKDWAESSCPEDNEMKKKHNVMLTDAVENFSKLMNSKETAEDMEKLEEEINEVYRKIEAENKKARDEKEILKKQKELKIKCLGVIKEDRRNEFTKKLKEYENEYEENFQDVFGSIMRQLMQKFDKETQDLRDDLDKELLEARIGLEKTMKEILKHGIQRNEENKQRLSRVDDAVKEYALKYGDALNELMLKAYVEKGGFEVIEKRYIEEVDALQENKAIKELIKEEIRKKTEQAKIDNEPHKPFRPVIANEDTVGNYLAIGAIVLTFPVWVPLSLIGLVVAGVVAGVVKLKDFIKKNLTSKKK